MKTKEDNITEASSSQMQGTVDVFLFDLFLPLDTVIVNCQCMVKAACKQNKKKKKVC